MPLIDASTEIGLLTPPALSVIVFVVGWNIEKTASGSVSPARAKSLGVLCLGLLVAAYTIVWWKELTAAWFAAPLLTTLCSMGVVLALAYLIFAIIRRPTFQDPAHSLSAGKYRDTAPRRSIPRRIFAWIVILWGTAGLIGGLVAIIEHSLKQ
jgi:hypothetical protein